MPTVLREGLYAIPALLGATLGPTVAFGEGGAAVATGVGVGDGDGVVPAATTVSLPVITWIVQW